MAVIHPAADDKQRAAFALFLQEFGLQSTEDLEAGGRYHTRFDIAPADMLLLQRRAARMGTTAACVVRGLIRSYLRRTA